MAHSKILKVLSVDKMEGVWITTVIDQEGNVATGVGKGFKMGDPILTYFHDKFNKVKFSIDNNKHDC